EPVRRGRSPGRMGVDLLFGRLRHDLALSRVGVARQVRYHRPMYRAIVLGIGALFLVACAGKPPANWVKGGAPIDVLPSRWVGSNSTVEVTPDGRVMLNTEHMMTVDRAGRMVDPDVKPLALLLSDGRVIGPDDTPLGFVGAWSAS